MHLIQHLSLPHPPPPSPRLLSASGPSWTTQQPGLSIRAITHNTCYSWVCLMDNWCYKWTCLWLIQFTQKVTGVKIKDTGFFTPLMTALNSTPHTLFSISPINFSVPPPPPPWVNWHLLFPTPITIYKLLETTYQYTLQFQPQWPWTVRMLCQEQECFSPSLLVPWVLMLSQQKPLVSLLQARMLKDNWKAVSQLVGQAEYLW